MEDLPTQLRNAGYNITPEYAETCVAKFTSLNAAIGAILTTDIRKKSMCNVSFCEDINSSDGEISKKTIVQIISVANIGQPGHAQNENTPPCTLQIKVTDGHTKATALCLGPIPQLNTNTPPGTKLEFASGTKYLNGKIIISASNCTFVGGTVESLLETWKASRYAIKLRKSSGAVGSTGSAPPKFDFQLSGGDTRPTSEKLPANVASAADGHTKPSGLKVPRTEKRNKIDSDRRNGGSSEKSRGHDSEEIACDRSRKKPKEFVKKSSLASHNTQSSTKSHESTDSDRKNIYSDKKPSADKIVSRESSSSDAAKRMISSALGKKPNSGHTSHQDTGSNRGRGKDNRSSYSRGAPKNTLRADKEAGNPPPLPPGSESWPELPVSAPTPPFTTDSARRQDSSKNLLKNNGDRTFGRSPCDNRSKVEQHGVNLLDFMKVGGSDMPSKKLEWTCASCTFMNHGALKSCEMCGISKYNRK